MERNQLIPLEIVSILFWVNFRFQVHAGVLKTERTFNANDF